MMLIVLLETDHKTCIKTKLEVKYKKSLNLARRERFNRSCNGLDLSRNLGYAFFSPEYSAQGVNCQSRLLPEWYYISVSGKGQARCGALLGKGPTCQRFCLKIAFAALTDRGLLRAGGSTWGST